MALRNIVTCENPILRKKSRKVEIFDEKLSQLIDDMFETLKMANGAGLAAVQVGVLKRVVVIDCGDGAHELVNPEIIEQSQDVQKEVEGCLSIPNQTGVTLRPMTVKVKAQDRHGKWHIYKGTGLKARAFCHETDHLDGILYTDRLIQKTNQDFNN